jgi:hypothetical protein
MPIISAPVSMHNGLDYRLTWIPSLGLIIFFLIYGIVSFENWRAERASRQGDRQPLLAGTVAAEEGRTMDEMAPAYVEERQSRSYFLDSVGSRDDETENGDGDEDYDGESVGYFEIWENMMSWMQGVFEESQ